MVDQRQEDRQLATGEYDSTAGMVDRLPKIFSSSADIGASACMRRSCAPVSSKARCRKY